jgi:hypothetical protein
VGETAQADQAKKAVHAILHGLARFEVILETIGNVLACCEIGKKGIRLKDDPNVSPGHGHMGKVVSAEKDIAGVLLFETGNDPEKRGFSTPTWSKNTEEFPPGCFEGYITQGYGPPELLGDAVYPEIGLL